MSNYDAEADALADRVATLERELAKADRRTAEQERVIASRGELIVKLREALDEVIPVLDAAAEHIDPDGFGNNAGLLAVILALGGGSYAAAIARLAELRKLTEAP